MARWREAGPIYDVADDFRRRCLVNRKSLLWPEKDAWTPENLSALWDAFIGRPDESKRTFLEKWRDQLADQDLDVHRVAADLMVFYYLFPGDIGPAAKSSGVREVIGWKLAAEGEPPVMSLVESAFRHSLGHAGPYYSIGRPW
jgi:hypothetical protein